MTQPHYIPDFRLLIDGTPAPAALRAAITGISVQSSLEGADRLELSLVNERLRWLDQPLLRLDRSVALSVGYASESLEQVFAGEIVGHNATFPNGGIPMLTVAAQDRIQRLQRGTKTQWFAAPGFVSGVTPLPDTASASVIAASNGLIPIFDPIGAALSVLIGGAATAVAIADPDQSQKIVRKQVAQSDYDFLRILAAENGWEMAIDDTGSLGGHQIRFMSLVDRLAPDMTLAYGKSLLEFTPRISTVGQIASISIPIWVPPLKTSFTVTVGWDWDRMALTIEVVPELRLLESSDSHIIIGEPVTVVSAPQRIISELIPRLNRRLTGSGSIIGDTRIKPGGVVRIEGIGEEFGGLHRVTSVSHSIDSGGFRTSFETRKEIWFGSIPSPAQGAIPVRLPQFG